MLHVKGKMAQCGLCLRHWEGLPSGIGEHLGAAGSLARPFMWQRYDRINHVYLIRARLYVFVILCYKIG